MPVSAVGTFAIVVQGAASACGFMKEMVVPGNFEKEIHHGALVGDGDAVAVPLKDTLAGEAVVVGDGGDNLIGVHGISTGNVGVLGDSRSTSGVQGQSSAANEGGVYGINNDSAGFGVVGHSKNGVGVLGEGGRLAGLFKGIVEVTGDIRLTGADLAEDFGVHDGYSVEPGTVLVIGSDETLQPSQAAYDTRVAGVASGAGGYRPGIVLDNQGTSPGRVHVALTGKVFCRVDAGFGSVEVGDLLTTSNTPGHAMKVCDSSAAFGAVLGKALRPLRSGTGVIPILVALQ